MKKGFTKHSNKDILLHIIREISLLSSADDSRVLKIITKNPSAELKTFSKSQIIEGYKKYKSYIKLSASEEKNFLDLIKMKKIRTMSGVTPVAVLTKPYPCPGKCFYCPNDHKMPKSYLSSEPGAQRALSNEFDPYLQVYNRLVAYNKIGHPTDKVEIIVLGGTWSFYPESYRIWFIKRCFDALNDFNPKKKTAYIKLSDIEKFAKCSWKELKKVHETNENSHSRCVGLVLETRPDYISEEEAVNLRRLGATKIQIGVQNLSDRVLNLNRRGHGVKETSHAFRILRSAGFKIHAHWMPNLYGSSVENDIKDYTKLISNKKFKPDEMKIYPCSLIDGTELYELYKNKKWKPYNDNQLLKILEKCISSTPRFCRLSRIVRDISSADILAGNKKSNFRQIAEKSLESKGIKINEIRYREIRSEKINPSDLSLKITKYDVIGSNEYFLEYVTAKDKIVGFLRLSLPLKEVYIDEIKNSAMIREVHVYGVSLDIGKESEDKAQHLGLGTKLIQEAEKISKNHAFKRISVISSIGTREYYNKLGYILGNLYQSKEL
jgi:elongator complex protein 3